MTTVTYSFDLGQTVFCVDESFGVKEAIVKQIDITVQLPNITPIIKYKVVYVDSAAGSAVFDETSLYDDIDEALAAYKIIVLDV